MPPGWKRLLLRGPQRSSGPSSAPHGHLAHILAYSPCLKLLSCLGGPLCRYNPCSGWGALPRYWWLGLLGHLGVGRTRTFGSTNILFSTDRAPLMAGTQGAPPPRPPPPTSLHCLPQPVLCHPPQTQAAQKAASTPAGPLLTLEAAEESHTHNSSCLAFTPPLISLFDFISS